MSTDLKFEWQDRNALLRKVRQQLAAAGTRIARVPEMAVRRGTFELQAIVQRLAPKKTSTLVRSIGAKVERDSSGALTGRVGTHVAYGPPVEYGTGIYGPLKREIVVIAKNKKGLFWGAYDENGKPIIRRSVRIKGMKPRAPFGRGVVQFLPRYLEIIGQELSKEASA